MNLIQWKDNRIVISPEAYGIKAFRNIWNSDKTKNKEKAIMSLTTLYFMYDPRSEFQIETNEDSRLEVIKEETGLPSNWKPDKLFTEAVSVYKYLTYTTSASILDGNRVAIKSIRTIIEKPIDELDLDDEAKLAYVEKLAKTVTLANKLAEDIAKAEKEIYKDVEEHSSKMRGKGVKTVGDDGLATLF